MVFWAGVALLCLYYSKKRSEVGMLKGESGTRYGYTIGDRLHYGEQSGVFSGIDITLPASLPNMYLDGKRGDGSTGPRHFMPKDQQISLEGNFGNYFTFYAPKGYQVLALSIMTPDVMQTLLREVPDCDIEFFQRHIRIIVKHKVHGRAEASAALLSAANKVLGEIDDKLRSWSTEDSSIASKTRLVVQDNRTVKLFGRNYRLGNVMLALFYNFLGCLVWFAVATNVQWPSHVTLSWVTRVFLLPVLFYPVLWFLVVAGMESGLLGRLNRFLEQ